MAHFLRHQLFADLVDKRTSGVLGGLFGLENLARSITVTALPLAGLRALEDTQTVSTYLFVAGALAVIVVLNCGTLIRLISRKFVFTLACLFIVLAAFCFVLDTKCFYLVGAALRSAAAGMVLTCISLYILDFIPNDKIVHAESTRISFAAVAWLIGVPLGAWLWENVSEHAPFVIAAVVAVIELIIFWILRFREAPRIKTPQKQISLLRQMRVYFADPHLRTAYIIATTRSMYWAVMYTYVPLYVVTQGLPTLYSSLALSTGIAFMLFAKPIGKVANRFGIRRSIFVAMTVTGSLTILGGLFAGVYEGFSFPLLTIAILAVASMFNGICDIIGNIPFIRIVSPEQRTQMTAIFSTWRDMAFVMTPGVASVVLLFGDVPLFFCVLGVWILAVAILSRVLPAHVD